MAKIDLSKLSFSELKEIATEAAELADLKRGEELKTLVNGWKLMADKKGFDITDVIAEFSHYAPKKRAAAARVKGAFMYVNPKNPEEGYRGKGPKPKWLADAIAKGKSLADFAV